MQKPFCKQHRPVGPVVGQVFASHWVFGPWKTPPAWKQSFADSTWQVPSGRQQAPVGTVQETPEHCVPEPRQIPCSLRQTARVAEIQLPFGKQQAPDGAGQLAVAQLVPLPRYTPPALVHWASVVWMQPGAPVAEPEIQQAPVAGGQVFVPHVVPGPLKRPPWDTHEVRVAITQEPSCRQQAPSGLEVGQVLALQVEPGPRQMPFWEMQSAWVVTEQVTPVELGMQQAPVGGGQRVGEHWEPSPW
jgi:hypothetical protein